MQRPPQAAQAQQAFGIYLDTVMAPRPLGLLGPMAQGLLTTTGTQDADLILSQALKMNMHEVPFYCSYHVNNTTLEFLLGSMTSWQRTTYQATTNLSGFIANRWPVRQTRVRDES